MIVPQTRLEPLVVTSPEIIGSSLSIDTTVLPLSIKADIFATTWVRLQQHYVGDQIIDFNGNIQTAISDGTAGSSAPDFSNKSGGTASDGGDGLVWAYTGIPDTTQVTVSIYNKTYVLSPGVAGFTGTTGATAAGASGAYPLQSWTTFEGSISVDPTISEATLQFVGSNYDPSNTPIWESQEYVSGAQIVDSNGNLQYALVGGLPGAYQPGATGSTGSWAENKGILTQDNQITWMCMGVPSITPYGNVDLIYYQTSDALVIAPPSGVSAHKFQNYCNIEWATPNYPGFLGVRVMLSTDPAGVNPPFVQFGDLVTNISSSANVPVTSNTQTTVDGNQTTIITVEDTLPVNYSTITITPANVSGASQFYAMLSTVIQDVNTNAVFESQQNGPIACGFVNLHVVNPTDFLALQRKEDIASRLMSQMVRLYPDLDISARSELRDLFIDPFSIELSNMSVREWFARCATSISAISQIDDADGDNQSDAYDKSPAKQQIARAYGLNPRDTQTFIDKQFDILGEGAGVARGAANPAVTMITFFSYIPPTTTVTFPNGIQLNTIADTETPSLTFITRTSATISPQSIDSFYNPQFGWYQVSVPAECLQAGSIGNVGAGTIRSIVSGAPNGWNATNLIPASFGEDTQSNAEFAAIIQDRQVVGVDSGRRDGYLVRALETPGIVEARVVAAGDLEMVRDWDSLRQKHDFGCVDIYARGTSLSQQDSFVAFTYKNSGTFGQIFSYQTCALTNRSLMQFSIGEFSTNNPNYSALQFLAQQGQSTLYFGTANARFDNVNGFIFLDPDELSYTLDTDSQPVQGPSNRSILNGLSANQVFQLITRLQSPLEIVPTLQPILSVISVSGNGVTGPTGVIPSQDVRLIYTSDFLLNGNSNLAGDIVAVNSTTSVPTTKNIKMISNVQTIDSEMDVPLNIGTGVPQDVLSVRSEDLSQLYEFGVDYFLTASGRYHTYSLNAIVNNFALNGVSIDNNGILTVVSNNDLVPGAAVTFGTVYAPADFLSGATATVATAGATSWTAYIGSPTNFGPTAAQGGYSAQNIAPGETVVVSYNKNLLYEKLYFISNESQTLKGSVPSVLNQLGFVYNTWLPESYQLSVDGTPGNNLTTDGVLISGGVPHDNRYIKVVFNGNLMLENLDYTLAVDPQSGSASITRLLTGRIGDSSTVQVSYFVTEPFDVSTEYPAYVEQLATIIESTRHACADVLIKAMVENQIDVSLSVELENNTNPETMDPIIRNTISIVLNNATPPRILKLAQSELVRQIKSLTGVASVKVPLTKLAKSDGAYDIDVIIPTSTPWINLAQDPEFATIQVPFHSFITEFPVLPDSTIPSGGLPDSFVGMLFEGQSFRRAMSVSDFLASGTPSFYIVGHNDVLPASYEGKVLLLEDAVYNPTTRAYRVTYQVWGEGGTKDISISNTEYFVPGRVTINYLTDTTTS